MAGSNPLNEPSASSSSTNAVSLSSLENVKAFLTGVQRNLREVFLNDRPRLEIVIFQSVFEIFHAKIEPYVTLRQQRLRGDSDPSMLAAGSASSVMSLNTSGESQQVLVEGKYILDYALQDVFASLLFLITEECVEPSGGGGTCPVGKDDHSDSCAVESKKTTTFPIPLVFSRDLAADRNTSLYYVSKSQRILCAQLLLFLCWCPAVSSEAVIRALYPLLLTAPVPSRDKAFQHGKGSAAEEKEKEKGAGALVESTLENHIAANLLDGERFAWRRRFVIQILNGVIMYRPHGIQSLYKVFIFTDKISPATASLHEAADCIHRLLLSDLKYVWKPIPDTDAGSPIMKTADVVSSDENNSSPSRVETHSTAPPPKTMVAIVGRGIITPEEHYQIICQQLVDLFTAHKEGDMGEQSSGDGGQGGGISANRESHPLFGTATATSSSTSQAQRGAAAGALREETFEDRLHLAVVLLLNRLLHLPAGLPASNPTYAAAYQRYCFTNKYFLTPAFGPLTLRSSLVDLERVEKAVNRLCTLVHGVQLGAASLALDTVIEVAMPGLLNLAAIRERLPVGLVQRLAQIWGWIEMDNLSVDLISEAAVRSCFMITKKQFVASKDQMERFSLSVKDTPCPLYRLLTGLYRSVLQSDILSSGKDGVVHPSHTEEDDKAPEDRFTPAGSLLQSKTMEAFARHCQYLSTTMTSYATAAATLTGAAPVDGQEDDDEEEEEETRLMEVVRKRIAEPGEAEHEESGTCRHHWASIGSTPARLRVAVFFLETYLETAPAAALFGPQATLRHTFEWLLLLLPLSAKCRAWAVTLADHLLSGIVLASASSLSPSIAGNPTTVTTAAAARSLNTSTAPQSKETETGLSLPSHAEERWVLRSLLVKFRLLMLSHLSPQHTSHQDTIGARGPSSMINTVSATSESSTAVLYAAVDAKLSAVIDALQLLNDHPLSCEEGNAASTRTTTTSASPASTVEALSSLHTLHQAVVDAMGRRGTSTTSLASVALSQLSSKVEDICLTGSHRSRSGGDGRSALAKESVTSLIQESLGKSLTDTLFHVLEHISDTYSAVSAIKVLCWMGMYRWDSPDSSVMAAKLWGALLHEVAPPPPGLRAGAPLLQYERAATFKVRLLDVVLAWCDYDHQGRTLRHMDDYGLRVHHRSVFDLLSLLCQAQQPDVVQVAALHCLGHYFPAVYPRVSLWKLSHVCKDVFRHTPIEMSKAACAAMLLQVCQTITAGDMASDQTQGEEDHSLRHTFQRDAELREIRQLASAMSTYHTLPPPRLQTAGHATSIPAASMTAPTITGGSRRIGEASRSRQGGPSVMDMDQNSAVTAVVDDHSAVVRRHGQAIQAILSTLDLLPLEVLHSSASPTTGLGD